MLSLRGSAFSLPCGGSFGGVPPGCGVCAAAIKVPARSAAPVTNASLVLMDHPSTSGPVPPKSAMHGQQWNAR
jgi:hypothetical protein